MPLKASFIRRYYLITLLYFGQILVSKGQSINTGNWRLIASSAYDSESDDDLTTALTTGTNFFTGTPFLSSGSRTLSVALPAMTNDGMMTFNFEYTGEDDIIDPVDYEYDITNITIDLYESEDSKDGLDGTWDLLSSTTLAGRLNDLQKADIPQSSGGKWFRVVFTNSEAVDVSLTEVAMYEFHTTGNNNYFLLVGASVMERSGGQSEFIKQVDDYFGIGNGYDPVVFNLAMSGTRIAQLESSIDGYLDSHPQATFVLIHSGGNNVTSTRPLEQADIATSTIANNIVSEMKSIVQKVIDAGKIPILARLTFRDYKSNPKVEGGLHQSEGSLPYNWLLDDIIEEYTPDYFDPVTQRGYIDFYELTLNDQEIIAGDGIHPDLGQGYKIINYWVKTVFRHLYIGYYNDAILYTETISNLADSVNTLTAIAKSTYDEADTWEARLLADQIANHEERIKIHEVLDALLVISSLPVSLLDFKCEWLENKAYLTWTTTSEFNNDYFSIEKSFDNMHWDILTRVDGVQESNEERGYEFYDFDQPNRSCYYRLSQTDYDGTSEILKTLSVRKRETFELNMFPNPTTGYFQLSNSLDIRYDGIEVFETSGVKVPIRVEDDKVILLNSSSGIFLVNIPFHDTVIHRTLIIK